MLKYIINRWVMVLLVLWGSVGLAKESQRPMSGVALVKENRRPISNVGLAKESQRPISNVGLAKESQRLIITAGLFDNNNPYAAFYDSRIFVGEQDPGFIITDTASAVFTYANTLFFSENGSLSSAEIIAASGESKVLERTGLIGHSYFALPLGPSLGSKTERHLGAAKSSVKFVSRKVGEKTIYAARILGAENISWPKTASSLKRIPAVMIKDHTGARALMVARAVGHAAHKLGLVDELMKKSQNQAVYLEVGTNQNEHGDLNDKLVRAVIQRQALLIPGTSEMLALHAKKDSFGQLVLVSPFNQQFHQKVSTKSATPMHVWSLTGGEKIWSFYKGFGASESVVSGLKKMADLELNPNKSLNIVRVFSESAAAEAAKSVHVDLVLLVARDPHAQLSSREVIDLKNASSDSFEQIAPIVVLSALDVSEVLLSGQTLNSLSQVEIIRHPINAQAIVAAKELADTFSEPDSSIMWPSLEKNWHRQEFNSALAGLLMKDTDVDAVVFETGPLATPISGAISRDVGMSRLTRPGRLSTIQINGRQLKKIAKLIGENKFPTELAIYGIDPKAKLIRNRTLNDNENFRVTVSEKALLEIFGFSLMGGLAEEVSVRAPFMEAMIGKLDNLLFLTALKTVVSFEAGESIDSALERTKTQQSWGDIVAEKVPGIANAELDGYLKNPYGTPRHTVFFNVEHLDLGFSKNVANDVYAYHQKEGPGLPMSRGGADVFAHLLIFSKMSLVYDAPGLITTLSNGIRFLSVKGFDEKPSKDKVTFGLDFRLPWERTVFKGKSVVLSPVWKTLYETKLAPFTFLSKNDDKKWHELKMLPRTNKLESLLGFNTNVSNLGFQFDLGGMMTADFNRSSVRDALDFGPGFNFSGKWSLFGPFELSSILLGYYLFPLPESQAQAKAALGIEGTVWLRIARFHDFSLSLMSDFLFATLQEKPKDLALSSIFGVTISYGRLMRIFG